jgi:hypothetical protein
LKQKVNSLKAAFNTKNRFIIPEKLFELIEALNSQEIQQEEEKIKSKKN